MTDNQTLPVSQDAREAAVRVDDLLYAHHVIKYNPVAARKCARDAFARFEQLILTRERNAILEEAAKVADERYAICLDAVKLIGEGKLYRDIDGAAATERCAALEAKHIAAAIRSKKGMNPVDEDRIVGRVIDPLGMRYDCEQ